MVLKRNCVYFCIGNVKIENVGKSNIYSGRRSPIPVICCFSSLVSRVATDVENWVEIIFGVELRGNMVMLWKFTWKFLFANKMFMFD